MSVQTKKQKNITSERRTKFTHRNLPSLYICLARNVLGSATHAILTGLQPCPIALESARKQWLTTGMELATAAGFMSSTFGCGVTAGVSHAGLLLLRQSCSGRLPSLTLAQGQQTL